MQFRTHVHSQSHHPHMHMHSMHNCRAAPVPDYEPDHCGFRSEMPDDMEPIAIDDTPIPLHNNSTSHLQPNYPRRRFSGRHYQYQQQRHSHFNPATDLSHQRFDDGIIPMEISDNSSPRFCGESSSPQTPRRRPQITEYCSVSPVPSPASSVTATESPSTFENMNCDGSYECNEDSPEHHDLAPLPLHEKPRPNLKGSFLENLENLADCMVKTNASRKAVRKHMYSAKSICNGDQFPHLEILAEAPTEAGREYADSRRELLGRVWDMLGGEP